MVVHEHEITFGIFDTKFVGTNPVINFYEFINYCIFSKMLWFFSDVEFIQNLEAFTMPFMYIKKSKDGLLCVHLSSR